MSKRGDPRHSRHPLYVTWGNIKARCSNPNLPNHAWYGKRGIRICDEWKNNFPAFRDWAELNGWAEGCGLQIDRKDNQKDYEPNNCRWVTPRENTLNREKQQNNKSGYTGVCKHGNRWRAQIQIKGKNIHLGNHETPETAVVARNNFIVQNGLEGEYRLQRARSGRHGY